MINLHRQHGFLFVIWSPECDGVPYYYGGIFIFNGWIPTPHVRYPPCAQWYVLRRDACNDAGDEIIHVYMQLISDSTPTSNDDSYKNKQRADINRAPIFLEGPMLPHLLQEGLYNTD